MMPVSFAFFIFDEIMRPSVTTYMKDQGLCCVTWESDF